MSPFERERTISWKQVTTVQQCWEKRVRTKRQGSDQLRSQNARIEVTSNSFSHPLIRHYQQYNVHSGYLAQQGLLKNDSENGATIYWRHSLHRIPFAYAIDMCVCSNVAFIPSGILLEYNCFQRWDHFELNPNNPVRRVWNRPG